MTKPFGPTWRRDALSGFASFRFLTVVLDRCADAVEAAIGASPDGGSLRELAHRMRTGEILDGVEHLLPKGIATRARIALELRAAPDEPYRKVAARAGVSEKSILNAVSSSAEPGARHVRRQRTECTVAEEFAWNNRSAPWQVIVEITGCTYAQANAAFYTVKTPSTMRGKALLRVCREHPDATLHTLAHLSGWSTESVRRARRYLLIEKLMTKDAGDQ